MMIKINNNFNKQSNNFIKAKLLVTSRTLLESLKMLVYSLVKQALNLVLRSALQLKLNLLSICSQTDSQILKKTKRKQSKTLLREQKKLYLSLKILNLKVFQLMPINFVESFVRENMKRMSMYIRKIHQQLQELKSSEALQKIKNRLFLWLRTLSST